MVIGLRLRTNEREVTWRYPVAGRTDHDGEEGEGRERKGVDGDARRERKEDDDEHIKGRLVVLGVRASKKDIDGGREGERGRERAREREREREEEEEEEQPNAAGYAGICMRRVQACQRALGFLSILLHRAIASSTNDILNI
jgi:hypothetical protein